MEQDTRNRVKATRGQFALAPLAAATFAACMLAACGGASDSTPAGSPAPASPAAPDASGTAPGPTGGEAPVVLDLPAALETCPPSTPGTAAPGVGTELVVQNISGWSNAAGKLSVAANGTRVGRESGLRSGVNCVSWVDANNKARALNLGAYLFDYVMNWGANRYVATDDAGGHPGFGYVVSHNSVNGNSPLGSFMNPDAVKTTVFAGANHAIHRVVINYTRDTEAGGNGVVVPVVIEWLVAAGRNDPVWAVNWKMNQAQNPNAVNFDTYRMDSRGPYGSIGWDGKTASSGQSEKILGVQWGAGGYKFEAVRLGGLTSGAGWNYTQLSPANYVKAITDTTPVEFGIVQTARDSFMGYPDGVSGRLNTKTSNSYGNACPGNGTLMPCAQDWPYQMMQYSAPDGSFAATPTTGKLMAWGTPYGWLGASTFSSFDYLSDKPGTGERSYGTYIAWGEYGAVDSSEDPVESAKRSADGASYWTVTSINSGVGAVATRAALPGSVSTRALPANGYNETYGAFEFVASAAGRVDLVIINQGLAGTNTTIRRPVMVFNDYAGAPPALKINSVAAVSGIDYLASYDTASRRLWVTVLRDLPARNGWNITLN